MTPQLSTVATDGGTSLTSAPDASHVELRNGVIWMWMDGVFGPVSRWEAIGALSSVSSSPIPSSQQRAQAIRAVLDRVMQ